MRKIFLFIAALCCTALLSAAQFNDLKTIKSGGVDRQYFLYVPDLLTSNSPIFISCHGMDQDYQYQKTNQMPWLPLMADTASFVVVYPVGQAVNGSWGNMSSGWDMDGMKDINFMLDVVSDVKANYNIDDTRVYMSGFSLGGAFAYYMAQKVPDKVAAVVSLSGYDVFGSSLSGGSRPKPIFHLHGTSDDIMNYSGVENYLKKWRDLSKCSSIPVILNNHPCSCGLSTLTTYTECDCDVEIKLFTASGVGHDWTGCRGFESKIWNFCKQYNTSCGKISPEEAIENVVAEPAATKRIEDGQLLIQRGGKMYSVTGQEVK